jgi:ethanolamine transporter EutH
MSHRLKVALFVLAFNIIGFAEGYLMRDLELLWLVPVVLVTALGAVLLSRRWLKRASH